MKRYRVFITLSLIAGIALWTSFGYAQEQEGTPLQDLIAVALKNNPKIQQALQQWKSEEYKINYVRGLPDPVASYGYFGEEVQTRVGPQEQKFGLSQKIPFPGKLRHKGEAQSKSAKIAQKKYEATVREVTKNIKLVYYDLFWIDKAIQVTEGEKDILGSLEQTARRRYESNQSSQQEVIKAQVEFSKLEDRLYILRQNRQSLAARLNSLLNRSEQTPIGAILTLDQTDFAHKLEDLIDLARQNRQELAEADFAVERAQHEETLARLDYLPDFTFGIEYTEIGGGTTTNVDDGQDAWMGKVSVNVPIWFGKLKAQVDAKKAALRAAQENKGDVENMVVYEVQDMKFKIDAYENIVTLYKTALIPQAEQAFDAAKSGYESGKVAFLDWLDSQRTLLQTRLAYYKAMVDYHKSIAALERIVGRDLE